MQRREGGAIGAEPVIAGVGMTKSFGHVEALRGASVSVRPGEVVAVFGDNGAGKSTLMKVLCGVYQPDAGDLTVGGRGVQLASIRDAQALGVEVVHQDLALAPHIPVLENMFLGHEPIKRGWRGWLRILDRPAMGAATRDAVKRLSIELPSVAVPVEDLSGGQKQAVAVARAVMWAKTAVIMDEPTAALGPRQSEVVCQTIRATAEGGLGVLVVSHDIPRLLTVADRVVVMRQGRDVLTAASSDVTVTDIVGAMVGQEIEEEA
jgi:simple sugar transport system ATP-binding protein